MISGISSSAISAPPLGPSPDPGGGPPIDGRTGPTFPPPDDGIDLQPTAGDQAMFAENAKTTVDCPPGTTPSVQVSGQKVTVICEKGPPAPPPAPILD